MIIQKDKQAQMFKKKHQKTAWERQEAQKPYKNRQSLVQFMVATLGWELTRNIERNGK